MLLRKKPPLASVDVQLHNLNKMVPCENERVSGTDLDERSVVGGLSISKCIVARHLKGDHLLL